MCNNILELANNPSNANSETDLSTDPNYDFENSLPDWLIRRRKRQEKLAEAMKWYQDLHWGWKLGIGIALLIGAIAFTLASGGGGAGVLSVLMQVAIGVGVGIGVWAIGTLISGGELTLEGLANAALDSFLASSAMAFVSSGVSFIKSLFRSPDVVLQSYELDPRSIAEAKKGNPSEAVFRKRVWQNEAQFNRTAYSDAQLDLMVKGKAPLVNGKSMHLHHVVGKSVDPYYVIKVTHAQHTAIHKAIGYHVTRSKLPWTLENAIKYGGLM